MIKAEFVMELYDVHVCNSNHPWAPFLNPHAELGAPTPSSVCSARLGAYSIV